MAVSVVATDEVESLDFTGATTSIAGVSFGSAAEGRIVGAWIYNIDLSDTGIGVDAVVIGGAAASKVVGASQSSGTRENLSFWWALLSGGETGSIDITLSDSAAAASLLVHVYSAIGADTVAPVFDSAADDTANLPTASIDIPEGGAMVAATSAYRASGVSGPVFFGLGNAVPEQSSEAVSSGLVTLRLESASSDVSGTPEVSAQWISGVSGETFMGLVSFQQATAPPMQALFTRQLRY